MTAAALPPLVATPETVIIDGFVIETYPAISHVPFASVSDQRGKAVKTSEHERFDELYGRCRTCMGHKSGEQLLLCDDCDRGFHMTCLVPALRDVPKGEWHCPNCTRDRNHTFHARATAVATLRKVLNDIEARPSLPPRLRLKFLDVPRPVVQFSRVPASAKSTSQQQQNDILPPTRQPPKSVPPKCRGKNSFALLPQPDDSEDQEPTILYKKVAGDSLQRRRDHISRLASDLRPMANHLGDKEVAYSLNDIQDSLAWARHERPEDEFVETRTSDNSLLKGNKRPRLDVDTRNCSAARWLSPGENSCPSQATPDVNGRQGSHFYNSEKCVEEQRDDSELEIVTVRAAAPASRN